MSDQDQPESPPPGTRQYFSSRTSSADILANLRRQHEAQERAKDAQLQAKNEPGAEQDTADTGPSSPS